MKSGDICPSELRSLCSYNNSSGLLCSIHTGDICKGNLLINEPQICKHCIFVLLRNDVLKYNDTNRTYSSDFEIINELIRAITIEETARDI